jgi:hypothetical protein
MCRPPVPYQTTPTLPTVSVGGAGRCLNLLFSQVSDQNLLQLRLPAHPDDTPGQNPTGTLKFHLLSNTSLVCPRGRFAVGGCRVDLSMKELTRRSSQSPPKAAFCVFSGKGVAELRDYLKERYKPFIEADGENDTDYDDEDEDLSRMATRSSIPTPTATPAKPATRVVIIPPQGTGVATNPSGFQGANQTGFSPRRQPNGTLQAIIGTDGSSGPSMQQRQGPGQFPTCVWARAHAPAFRPSTWIIDDAQLTNRRGWTAFPLWVWPSTSHRAKVSYSRRCARYLAGFLIRL